MGKYLSRQWQWQWRGPKEEGKFQREALDVVSKSTKYKISCISHILNEPNSSILFVKVE